MPSSKTIKVFILSVLILAITFLLWQKLNHTFLKQDFSWRSLIWLGIWLFLFLVFWLIFSLLVPKSIAIITYFFSLAIFFLFFKFHYYLLIGLVILFLIFILSRSLMQKERNERLKISLIMIFKKGMPLMTTFLAFFFALISYFYPLTKIDKEGINLSPQILEMILKPLKRTIVKVLPFFELEMTIDEMVKINLALEKIDLDNLSPEIIKNKKFQGKNLKEINFDELLKDPEINNLVKKQAENIDPKDLAQKRNELAKNLGIELKGNEKIAEVINKLANKQLTRLFGPYLKYLPIISAIFVFFVLRIIFIPFSWLVLFFSLLIFQILILFHFVRIEKVMKEGEDISI